MTHPNRTMLARFFKKVRLADSGCWEWIGGKSSAGYGSFSLPPEHRHTSAHRIGYSWFVGPVSKSEVVDHLCRNVGCVNPAHLEAVSQSVNVARGLTGQQRPTCKRGHAMTPDNVVMQTNYGERFRTCRICRALRETRRREKRRALAELGGGEVVIETNIRIRRVHAA